MFVSIPIPETSRAINTSESTNPYNQKCQIKVCYVCDTPNRKGGIMTEAVLEEMGKHLPGSPIAGLFMEEDGDFGEHEKKINFNDKGQIVFDNLTIPYGYVDDNAKVWFEEFMDEDGVRRKYLMTEGTLWVGRYPEIKNVINRGCNQSMELDPETLDVTRVGKNKDGQTIFIINEAFIKALCILGENHEPAFEGASVTTYSLNSNAIKEQFVKMESEFSDSNNENIQGGTHSMNITQYAVNIGSALWNSIYNKLEAIYPDKDGWGSKYSVEGVYEEDATKFAILRDPQEGSLYRMNFSLSESTGIVVAPSLTNVSMTFNDATAQYSLKDIKEWEDLHYARKAGQSKATPESEFAKKNEDEEKEKGDGKKKDEDEEDEKAKTDHSADETPATDHSASPTPDAKLLADYAKLQATNEEMATKFSLMEKSLQELTAFKAATDKKEKEDMIASFYMLSDEMKTDVVTNIDNYSLSEIEAKLAVECVRNKINFSNTEDEVGKMENLNYSVNQVSTNTAGAPSWISDARKVQKELNNI